MSDRERIGRYEIVSPIRDGGMGSVHLARDPQLNRQVALKLLLATLDTDEWRRRFQREAKALARLDHQNIVTIFDFGEDNHGRPYIVMEYVRGRDLGELVGTPLPLVQKLTLLEQLCSGLDFAHQAGIAHLDIKPANLIVGRGWPSADRGLRNRARSRQSRDTADRPRPAVGHAELHGAGAGAWRDHRSARRSVRGRSGRVRAVVGPPRVRGHAAGSGREDLRRRSASAVADLSRNRSCARGGRRSRAEQTSPESLSIDGGDGQCACRRSRTRLDSHNSPTITSVAVSPAPSGQTTLNAPLPTSAAPLPADVAPAPFRDVVPEQSRRRSPARVAIAALALIVMAVVAFVSLRPGEKAEDRRADASSVRGH